MSYISHIKEIFVEWWFFILHGYRMKELYNLSYYLSKYILVRLKAFRDHNSTYPPILSYNEWLTTLDEMIWAFEWEVSGEIDNPDTSKDGWEVEYDIKWKKFNKGLELFSKYFRELWY
jgi:hypothetical protein